MRRRDFIAGLMIAAATGRAQAQQTGKVYRIAFAHATVPVADQNQASKGSLVIPAIFEELLRLGYVEGRNLLIERYSGEGRADHYPDLARQIVSRNPDLIIAVGQFIVLDIKAATSTIPIIGVFGNPIAFGIFLHKTPFDDVARGQFLVSSGGQLFMSPDKNYNVGAIFRLCDAFLVQELVVCGTKVELHKRRLVQAAQRTQHWVPLLYWLSLRSEENIGA
jgi:hypothetical protein